MNNYLHYIFIQPDLLFVFLWPLNFLYLRSSLIPFDSRFSPEAINWLFDKGLRDWFGQDALFKPASIEFQHPFLSLLWKLISSELSSLGFFFPRFSPEALNWLFVKGLLGWFMQVALLKIILLSLGSGEAPLLDMVAYAGYTFTGMCFAVLGKILPGYSYYILMPCTCLCMGIFLVKTMKRVLFAEVRSVDSSRHHYLLLLIGLVQFPLFAWLGNVSVNWFL